MDSKYEKNVNFGNKNWMMFGLPGGSIADVWGGVYTEPNESNTDN